MDRIALALEVAGFTTFVPHRDGLETPVMAAARLPGAAIVPAPVGKRVRRAIFALDVFQIVERCAGLVINLNGRVPDEGAVAEAAIAFAVGRPLVLYKDDARSMIAGEDNPMITGLSATFSTVGSVDELAASLQRVMVDTPTYRPTLPPHLLRVVQHGRRVWAMVEAWRHLRPPARTANALLDALEAG